MKQGVWLAGLLALAVLGWRAARRSPPARVSGKAAELEAIMASGNDNDPALDRDFNALTPDEKADFRRAYAALPAEKRNQRGTIVYLLGKNAAAPEDWEFFRAVAAEPPCLSLSDCAKASSAGGEPGDDVTLAYPSLVALKQAQRALEEGRSVSEARAVVAAGKSSKMPAVIRLAEKLDRRFPKP